MKRITPEMDNSDLLALAMSLLVRADWAKGISKDLRLRYERILFCAATVQYYRETNDLVASFCQIQKDEQPPFHTDEELAKQAKESYDSMNEETIF